MMLQSVHFNIPLHQNAPRCMMMHVNFGPRSTEKVRLGVPTQRSEACNLICNPLRRFHPPTTLSSSCNCRTHVSRHPGTWHKSLVPLNCGVIGGLEKRQPGKSVINQAITMISGGERGIRTPDTVPRIHTFQACAFNHSATSPRSSPTRIECASGGRRAS